MKYCSVYITTRDESEARKIGQMMVTEKLAACVNFFPVKSIYRWQGDLEESTEMALIAKTRTDLLDCLIRKVKEQHSYEVPCIVSWTIEKGNPDFLDWILQATDYKDTVR